MPSSVITTDDAFPRGEIQEQLSTITDWVADHADATINHAKNQRRDAKFYDGKQWDPDDLRVLEMRGQPPVVLNRIFTKVNDIIGFERENKTDFGVWPRTFDTHQEEATAASDALKFWEDQQKFDQTALMVLENLVKQGVGGGVFDVTTERDPLSDGKRDRNRWDFSYLPWDRLWWDPHSRLPDFSDALYTGILTWMHLNEALKLWPDKEEALRAAVDQNEMHQQNPEQEDHPNLWYWSSAKRLAIRTVYYYDINDDGHRVWYHAKFVHGVFLEEPEVVPWEDDNGLTFNPMRLTSAFVAEETNERYGAIRMMIWPQQELNKRRSKALDHFTRGGAYAERSAVDDATQIKQEMAKPDAIVVLNDGALAENRFIPRESIDRGQLHLQLAQEAKIEIDELGPVAVLNNGVPSDLSGKSFALQQEAGMRKIGPLFAHFRDWKLDVATHAWYGIRFYWPEERWIRIRDSEDSAGYRFVRLNKKLTRADRVRELMLRGDDLVTAIRSAMGVPGLLLYKEESEKTQKILDVMGDDVNPALLNAQIEANVLDSELGREKFVMNDISKLDVDLVLDVRPHSTILEHEEFAVLAELRRNGSPIPDIEIVKRAKNITNVNSIVSAMSQPPDPEVVRRQAIQADLELDALRAQIQKVQAEAAQANAKSQTLIADMQKKLAEAQLMIPAEANRDAAQSKKLIAEAGLLRTESVIKPEHADIEREKNDIRQLEASNKAIVEVAKLRSR